MNRLNNRNTNQLRPINFELGYTKWAEGSVLVSFGDTKVLCNATIDHRVPHWLHQSNEKHGWVSAEYGMLPRSTEKRVDRERQWPKGRTQEISRLIGRSLRMAVDLHKLGQRQILLDCDVLQADGGTRTAAITGGWVALNLALQPLIQRKKIPADVIKMQLAAVSVGLVGGVPLLDLDYDEDSQADADLNVVMTSDGRFIELQGTGEQAPFDKVQLAQLLGIAETGIQHLITAQRELLYSTE